MSRVKSQLLGVQTGGITGRTPARSVSEDGHAAGNAAMRGGAPIDVPPSTNRGGTERPAIGTVQELQMVMTDTGELKTILVRRPVNEQVAMIDTLRFTVGEETWNRTAGIQLVADEAFIFEASKHLTQVFGFGITRDLKKSRDFYTNAWELGDNYGHVAFGGASQRGTMLINLSGQGCIAAKAGWESRLFDGGGLYLQLKPAGSKTWWLKFRFNGKENRISFGGYPLVSLGEAREKRDAARKLLLDGIDPSKHRAEAKRQQTVQAANLFSVIADEWIENKRDGWSEHHAERIRKQLDREVCPHLGFRPIGEITSPDLLAVIRRIEGRGALETARKTLQTCGQIFRYAVMTGKAERDPSGDLRGALRTRPVKNMTRVDASELPGLMRKIDTYQGRPETRLAIKLLALTFVRTIELRHAEWTEIDIEKAEWRIPADKMKMARPHIVPLARQTLGVIEELRELTGEGRRLFPHAWRGLQPMSENTVLYALYRMGYHSRMTGHGFRGLASTILNERGFSSDWIERQLAHIDGNGVRAAYNHAQYLDGRRTMMQWWADYLERESQPNVLPFAARG